MRPKIKKSHPNISNTEISSMLGKLWMNQQKSSIQNKFQKMANIARELHKECYPNYKYQPKTKTKKAALKKEFSEPDSQKKPPFIIFLPDPFSESIENFPIETCDFPVSSFDV
jgi:hypothetical protein